MRYLVDTCVLSELVKPAPEPHVVRWVDGHPEDALFLSVLTLGELHRGIAKLPDSPHRSLLATWVDTDLRDRFGQRMLTVDAEVAEVWGTMTGESETRGDKLPVIDSLLAATATVHRLCVATRNVGDFQRCRVPVVNPWQG